MDRISKLSPEKRALLESRLIKHSAPVVADLKKSPARQSGPLSHAQKRLWFLEQYQPGNTAYNYVDAIRLLGALNVAALEQALNEVIRRHEALRTVFRTQNEQTLQVVLEHTPLQFPVTVIKNIPELQRNAYLRQVAVEDFDTPFDLSRGPLLRIRLLRFDEQDHALTFVTHHINFDGWSFGVLVRELMVLYEAYLAQKRSPLPEPTAQYLDFVEWQHTRLQGDAFDKHLAYWKQQLGGTLPQLNLPLDRPRPPRQTFKGKYVQHAFSPELTDAIRATCKKERVTLFMLTLSAFKTLLHRYSGQDDIIVGTPIAGRTQQQFESLIGLFTNMLALRTQLTGNPTFREVLAKVRDVSLDAYEHQDVPLDKLVEVLQPERTQDRSPIFQVNFILQNTPLPKAEVPNLQVVYPSVQQGSARFDLTLVIWEVNDCLHTMFEFNTDLFETHTIRRMLNHYEMLLRGVIANPARRIDALPLLGERERQQMLVEWNATRAAYPTDKTIHALIEAQAEQTPDAVAVVCEGKALTYAQLNREANRAAWRLREMGVQPGVLVGICLERSLELVVGVLAVLKAGGAYVPMDPHFPAERLAHYVADTRMPVLIADASSTAGLDLGSAKMLELNLGANTTGRDDNPSSGATANDLAYVIFTSGSTGKPKGVQIQHRSVVNFLQSMRKEPGITRSDVLLSVTTLSFDIAGLELFLPLVSGAKVVLVSREKGMDGGELLNLLLDSRATMMQATPSTWRLLIEAGWKGIPDFKGLCGGEPLPVKLAEQLLLRNVELWNMYGPTETTIWSSVKRIDRADQINIGRPIANTQMYVLNAALEPNPIGVAGELYIGGDGVARGYLNRAELTAERFIPNPFVNEPGARMYRTGDIARYLADGEIQCLGRSDHQVKIRGHRIELGEIETALGKHMAVAENTVVASDDNQGVKRLVAYLVLRPGMSAKSSELRSFLEKVLPEYMVPSLFVMLEALPLTPNGKIDRKALPEPEEVRSDDAEEFVAPRTDVERLIAQIMADVLNLSRVGALDNFFELGGHSLLIFQVISRVRNALHVEIPVRSLFEGPTVARMAEIVETIKWAQNNQGTPAQAVQVGGEREEDEL